MQVLFVSPRWLTLFLIASCGGPAIRAQLETPALIPVQTFPHVYVSTRDTRSEGGSELGTALLEHLALGPVQAEWIDMSEIEARRAQGQIRAPSVVLMLSVTLRSGYSPRQVSEPETICGPSGCFTRQRSRLVHVPNLQGRLLVEVYEGHSARLLQQQRFESEEQQGNIDVLLRDAVISELRQRLLSAIEPQRVSVRIPLVKLSLEGVNPALELLAAGEWSAGRQRLEELWERARSLPSKERAAFLFNLGTARRFDTSTLAQDMEAHFDAAERALQAAVRLDPDVRYARALSEVREHRAQLEAVEQQRAAAEHNFQLDREGYAPESTPSLPPPPQGYE